jgi:type VI secretion system protein ImpH
MAIAERQATRDLADNLLADARNYSFFRLVEHLHALHGDDLDTQPPSQATRQRVRLQSYAGLGFPASDVMLAARLPHPASDRYRVQTTFLGLHGADSPLPGYYLDTVAYESAQESGIRPAFLDFFNHRLLNLLHHTWRKYRYYVRFQPQASDQFSRYLFSLIGLNDEQLRGNTPIPWSRLLSYAGLIASRSRSPAIVAGIIGHCFDLENVRVREFESRYVTVPAGQRLALGKRNGVLGDSFVLGGRTKTRSSKFTLVIPELSQQRFRDFLPSGHAFEALNKLIEFLLRDVIAFDLELGLKQADVPSFNLGRTQGAHLGWTSFMNTRARHPQSVVRIKVRA